MKHEWELTSPWAHRMFCHKANVSSFSDWVLNLLCSWSTAWFIYSHVRRAVSLSVLSPQIVKIKEKKTERQAHIQQLVSKHFSLHIFIIPNFIILPRMGWARGGGSASDGLNVMIESYMYVDPVIMTYHCIVHASGIGIREPELKSRRRHVRRHLRARSRRKHVPPIRCHIADGPP